jgi:Mor family transcriptional regulator
MYIKVNEQIKNDVLKDYELGLKHTQLAKKHGLSIFTITRILKGIHTPKTFMTQETKDAIIFDFKAGYPVKTLVEKYNVSTTTIRDTVKNYRKPTYNKYDTIPDSVKDMILKDYLEALPYEDIINIYSVTKFMINKITANHRAYRKKLTKVKHETNFNLEISNFENIPFVYSHTGIDNQKVYKFIGIIKGKNLYIEMIELSSGEWVYHCENSRGMVCDSRISNRSYDSIEECKEALYQSLVRKNYFKNKG